MSVNDRLRSIEEKLSQAERADDPMAGARLAFDLVGMAATIPNPDPVGRGRQLAKAKRLREAVTSGDLDGLLPGDLTIRDPAAMIAAG